MTNRIFTGSPVVRKQVYLLFGLVGESFSGKTYSALRLAKGIQRVTGGEIGFLDTEDGRGTHYADYFKPYRYYPFEEPFGPLDYLAGIQQMKKDGCKIGIVDQMSYEHSGPGGIMDQIDKFLDEKCGDNWEKREKWNSIAHARIKPQRKKLNDAIKRMGMHLILLYRAEEKTKPVKDDKGKMVPTNLGWMPDTTSKLHYQMTQRWLLVPGCQGVPILMPSKEEEQRMVKTPEMFRGFFKDGEPLSEDLGERMARWAKGEEIGSSTAELLNYYAAVLNANNQNDFDRLEGERKTIWSKISKPDQAKLKAASDAAKTRLKEQGPAFSNGHTYGVDEPTDEELAAAVVKEGHADEFPFGANGEGKLFDDEAMPQGQER